ncbi:MAG: type I restriction enzyme HsdR N-terminal domain-containing protein [Prolixibacteraceae bacterium]|nr:type I restriction enzyme HsdR N-terminal domain-containing protein [Prolixibacteraceae bacterium]
MHKLNLPDFGFRISDEGSQTRIFDQFRRKWVALTPEEWVRQHMLRYMADFKNYPRALMAVEKKVDVNGLSQRFDLLIYNRRGKPLLIAEFKSPDVKIDQRVFDQMIRYNTRLLAPLALASNGMNHFICKLDFENHSAEYLSEIPDYLSIQHFG